MPAKKPVKKKAKAKSAAAPEKGVSMAQLNATVDRAAATVDRASATADRVAASLDRLIAQDAKHRKEYAKREKEYAKREAKMKAEQAARDAKWAKRDAERDDWMMRLEESDEQTRKRIEDAEKARGRVAETLFRKALPGLLAKEGMPVDHVEPRSLKVEDREYDFIARNGRMNFVGEIKVRFRARDLAQLRSALAKFREDCPELAGDRPIYGVVCGMVVDEDAANIARKEGFLVVDGRTEAKLHMPPRIQDH